MDADDQNLEASLSLALLEQSVKKAMWSHPFYATDSNQAPMQNGQAAKID
jgi:hypothetical protein